MQSGDYGLHIVLATKKNNDALGRHDLFFSAEKDMYGNIYAFKIYTSQEIKYRLTEWNEELIGIQIFLYQDGNFKYINEFN